MAFNILEYNFNYPENWQLVRLGDIAQINPETIGKNTDLKFIKYIDISSVSSHSFEKPKEIAISDAPSRAKRKLKDNDFIISTVRPNLKQYTFLNKVEHNWICSTGFCVVRANNENLSWYLYSLVSSEIFTDYLTRIADGGAYPAFNPKEIEGAIIPLPDEDSIIKIASFTKNINEKIHLNQQTNQTLEAIAQAIFKSWFVDFDPVRAKAQALSEGKSEREVNLSAMAVISGKTIEDLSQTEYQELWEIADAFPSELVENIEFGEVPKGWGIAPLSTFGEIICGKTPTKSKSEYYGNNIPFIKIPDMHGKVFITQTIDNLSLIGANSQATKYISKGSICVSCIATVGLVSLVSRKSQTNQQINSIVPNNLNFSEYLYLYLSQSEMNKYMKSLASGGSATLNMNTSTFSSIQILKPNNEILDLFHKKSLDIFEKILKNEENNQILAQTRDLLLPKLLSGEIEL